MVSTPRLGNGPFSQRMLHATFTAVKWSKDFLYDDGTTPRKRYRSRRRKKVFIGVGFLSGALSITILDGEELGRCRWFCACEATSEALCVLAGPGRAGRRRAGGLRSWRKRCESGTPRCGVKRIGWNSASLPLLIPLPKLKSWLGLKNCSVSMQSIYIHPNNQNLATNEICLV